VVEETLAGRGELIKEYMIGVEAFQRGDNFDPRLDPIVRTQARKLRARLEKYYAGDGAADSIRIEFHKGSYTPAFSWREAHVETIAEPEPHPAPASDVVESAPEVPALIPSPTVPPSSTPQKPGILARFGFSLRLQRWRLPSLPTCWAQAGVRAQRISGRSLSPFFHS
jgi:hypothetical protein